VGLVCLQPHSLLVQLLHDAVQVVWGALLGSYQAVMLRQSGLMRLCLWLCLKPDQRLRGWRQG